MDSEADTPAELSTFLSLHFIHRSSLLPTIAYKLIMSDHNHRSEEVDIRSKPRQKSLVDLIDGYWPAPLAWD